MIPSFSLTSRSLHQADLILMHAMEAQGDLSFTARLALLRVQESKRSFPFEKFPPEIRNRIYDYVLTGQDSHLPMLLRFGQHGLQYGLSPRSKSKPCFSVLFLNKAINREAASYLYSVNTFDFNLSWLRNGGFYFERDIRSISDFFSGLTSTVELVRKVHVVCDARTLVTPAWETVCRYLDTQLHLKELSLKIDLHGTYKPRRGTKPVSFLLINHLLAKTLSYFSSLQKPVFDCTLTPAICQEWSCPSDRSLVYDLHTNCKDYLTKTKSTTLW